MGHLAAEGTHSRRCSDVTVTTHGEPEPRYEHPRPDVLLRQIADYERLRNRFCDWSPLLLCADAIMAP